MGGGSVQGLNDQKPVTNQAQPIDPLALTPSADSATSQPQGITTPWHPAARAGGGAALPPRGGSGNGAQAATVALVAGRGGHAQTQPSASLPATIPGYMASNPPQTAPAAGGAPAPVVTRNAAAAALAQGSATVSSPVTASPAAAVAATSPTVTTIDENASSLPSSTSGNSSEAAMEEFTYYPLYTLDYNQGTVLFPGGYQLATLGGQMDLRAQTSGATGVTYSWDTSDLTGATSISGTSTYDLTFTWPTFMYSSGVVDSVTLTATDGGEQQESQTYYFRGPGGYIHGRRGQHDLADHALARHRQPVRPLLERRRRQRQRRLGRPRYHALPAELQHECARARIDL